MGADSQGQTFALRTLSVCLEPTMEKFVVAAYCVASGNRFIERTTCPQLHESRPFALPMGDVVSVSYEKLNSLVIGCLLSGNKKFTICSIFRRTRSGIHRQNDNKNSECSKSNEASSDLLNRGRIKCAQMRRRWPDG